MIEGFAVHRRNYGHWDITAREHGRLFRLRGGPGAWDLIDERVGKGQNSTMLTFRDQSAAMAYACAELMHELLTVEGQQPHVMESWNINWTRQHDPLGPAQSN
ncbi:hypothetical protein [Aurantimonas phage AmM-1]|uniref:hypothetical protein n=1 Tax=Aurantimonas phage AmM-1 TaxID=1503929 RepID=UPI000540A780|nr:hypothetical protein ACQ23_gp39 [Aurantimonas phage AmM-1]BAP94496.1 hypothetical protein [Aurantimonas phage AmM-1]